MKPTILVVDDNAALLAAIQEVLNLADMYALAATDGEDALKLYQEHDVDLVLLDWRLAGMSGAEVLAELCRLDPGVRVILASASDLRDVVTGHDNVVAGIRKPFDRGQLVEVIESVLG
jgi:DNA-binding response OmpR family regulator